MVTRLLSGQFSAASLLAILILLFLNLGLNDIWTPNEAFYAEAVREMQESGNYLDTYYNYEPRHRKPPLTYWFSALSTEILGISEFSLRLPVALAALGTIILTYLIGATRHGPAVGWLSALIVSFSLQFIANARYLSPEVPLTFVFTLTLYLFQQAVQRKSPTLSYLAFLSLGMVVLTKGLPFVVVIVGIMGLFLCWERAFSIQASIRSILQLRIIPGTMLALLIGSSWYFYSYLTFGQEFLNAQFRETVHRAISEESFSLEKLFFYLPVLLWGFLPYGLAFYYAVVALLVERRERISELRFELSWILVIVLVFTAASGKIPTYVIPAHPAMAVLTAWALIHVQPKSGWLLWFRRMGIELPAGLLFLAAAGVSIYLGLDWYWPITILAAGVVCFRSVESNERPFWGAFAALLLFGSIILPLLESARPYEEIGQTLLAEDPEGETPLLIEAERRHNLPYYAKRKVYEELSLDDIRERIKIQQSFVLLRKESADAFPQRKLLWEGRLYSGGSESRTARLLTEVLKERAGKPAKFSSYVLLSLDMHSAGGS